MVDKLKITAVEQTVNDIDKLTIEQLEDFIQIEKEEWKKYKEKMPEADIQEILAVYCNKHNIICEPSLSGVYVDSYKSRKNIKKIGGRKGYPDFTIKHWNGKENCFCLETKTICGTLSNEQKDMFIKLKRQKISCSVSWGLYDTIYKLQKYLAGEPIIWEGK